MTLDVGVDVAQATPTSAVWDGGQSIDLGTRPHTPDGFAALAAALTAYLPPDGPVRLVPEPTGGYELALACWAVVQGWEVWVWEVFRTHTPFDSAETATRPRRAPVTAGLS